MAEKPLRQSIQPTYDHRETGDRYSVEYRLNSKRVGYQTITDPFVRGTVRIHWRDLLRSLFRFRMATVEIHVRGDDEIEADVMELDANYLHTHSTRRQEFKGDIEHALQRLAMHPTERN